MSKSLYKHANLNGPGKGIYNRRDRGRCEACPARNRTVRRYQVGEREVDLCGECALTLAQMNKRDKKEEAPANDEDIPRTA